MFVLSLQGAAVVQCITRWTTNPGSHARSQHLRSLQMRIKTEGPSSYDLILGGALNTSSLTHQPKYNFNWLSGLGGEVV